MKKLIRDFKKSYENDKSIYYLLAFLIFQTSTYELFNRPFGRVRNLYSAIDDMIPFVKELIVVYNSFLPFLLFGGVLIYTYDRREFSKFIRVQFLSQILAYLIFMTFQTRVTRVPISHLGDDIFSKMVKFTYSVDDSYSGLPSLHAANMTSLIIGLSRLMIDRKCKILLIFYAGLVAATTVFVKQHVFIDLPAGILFALAIQALVDFSYKKNKKA